MARVTNNPRRILVVVPNWVGDVILASPALAALRSEFANAHIAFLLRRYVTKIVEGCGWHDELVFWPDARGPHGAAVLPAFAARLRKHEFDAALLLTNSFRSALAIWLAGIPRRIGYAREARGWLLTERLKPLRSNGQFVPASVLPYYAAVIERLGCTVADRRPRLHATREQAEAAEHLRRHYGLDRRPYAVINPGAKFGASKCWLPERFAEICDRLAREHDLQAVLVGAPPEYALLRDIARQAHERPVVCDNPGTTLGSLKGLIGGAALLICNDTGPRHYGIATGRPTVTIFGPTHQEWTDTGYPDEIKLQARVECGPCQLPRCPLDLRCMTAVSTEMVMHAVRELLSRQAAAGACAGRAPP